MNLTQQFNSMTAWQKHQMEKALSNPVYLTNPKIGKAQMHVTEMFKLYQDQILKEAKKSEKDYIKETFAKAELFDVSNLEHRVDLINFIPKHIGNNLVCPVLEEITLPFEVCFVKVYDDAEETNGIFIKEYSPEYLTGAVFLISRRFGLHTQLIMPFTLDINRLELIIESNIVKKELLRKFGWNINLVPELEIVQFKDIAMIIHIALHSINRVNEYATLVDCTNKKEYYALKGKPTIKRENRIIYYLLDRKKYENRQYNIQPITKLEYSHCFRVRGHWRRFDGIGKNRQGIREINGYTWVKDYTKGEGELIKKVRVVK